MSHMYIWTLGTSAAVWCKESGKQAVESWCTGMWYTGLQWGSPDGTLMEKKKQMFYLICMHYMLPDNKLQFNQKWGNSHSVVINKWLGACIIYHPHFPGFFWNVFHCSSDLFIILHGKFDCGAVWNLTLLKNQQRFVPISKTCKLFNSAWFLDFSSIQWKYQIAFSQE